MDDLIGKVRRHRERDQANIDRYLLGDAPQQQAIGRHVLGLLQDQQPLTSEALLDSLRQEAVSGKREPERKLATHLVGHLLALTSRG